MKKALAIALIVTVYAIVAFAGAWYAIGESAERCNYADSIGSHECN